MHRTADTGPTSAETKILRSGYIPMNDPRHSFEAGLRRYLGRIQKAATASEMQSWNAPPIRVSARDIEQASRAPFRYPLVVAVSPHFSNYVAHRASESGKSCFARTT